MLESPQKQAEDWRRARPAYELATALLIALVLAVWSLCLGRYFSAVHFPVNGLLDAIGAYDERTTDPQREEQTEQRRRQQDQDQHELQNLVHLAEVYTVRPRAAMVLTGSRADFCYTSCAPVAFTVYNTCVATGADPQTDCFQQYRAAFHSCYRACEKVQ